MHVGANRYAERGGVCSMFPWQADCLSTDGGACAMRGRNLIYSAVSPPARLPSSAVTVRVTVQSA